MQALILCTQNVIKHEIDWEGTKCLEKEKRTIPRKTLQGCHIRGNRKICRNQNDGLKISAQYGDGEGHGYGGERKTQDKPGLSTA